MAIFGDPVIQGYTKRTDDGEVEKAPVMDRMTLLTSRFSEVFTLPCSELGGRPFHCMLTSTASLSSLTKVPPPIVMFSRAFDLTIMLCCTDRWNVR